MGVKDKAVLVKGDEPADSYYVAYKIAKSEKKLTPTLILLGRPKHRFRPFPIAIDACRNSYASVRLFPLKIENNLKSKADRESKVAKKQFRARSLGNFAQKGT
jgi:hypothetical protein